LIVVKIWNTEFARRGKCVRGKILCRANFYGVKTWERGKSLYGKKLREEKFEETKIICMGKNLKIKNVDGEKLYAWEKFAANFLRRANLSK
jgi:hypothetical protein